MSARIRSTVSQQHDTTNRTPRGSRTRRAVALVCVSAALAASVPSAAVADEFWGLWASEVKQRVWWERPFAIVFSLPAMLVTTPFWAGTKAYGSLKNRGGDDDE